LRIARRAGDAQSRFEAVERLHVVIEREIDQLSHAGRVGLAVVDRSKMKLIEDSLQQRLVRHGRRNRDERDQFGLRSAPARRFERRHAPSPQLPAEETIVVEVSVHHRHRRELPEHPFRAGIRAAKNREVAGELVERLSHRVEECAVVEQRLDRQDHAPAVRRVQLVPVKKTAADEWARRRRPVRIEPHDLFVRGMPQLEARWRTRVERLLDDFLERCFGGGFAGRLRIGDEQRERRRHRGREHAEEDPLTHR